MTAKDNKQLLKQKFLEYYRELPNQALAADSIGVHEDTIADWKKADPDFSDQVRSAKANWAMGKTKRVRNQEWLLERVLNDHFGQKSKLETDLKVTGMNVDFIENES